MRLQAATSGVRVAFRSAVTVSLLAVCLGQVLSPEPAESPTSGAAKATAWLIWPEELHLVRPLQGAQLLVREQVGSAVCDHTRQAEYRSEPTGLVRVDATGWVEPLRDGTGCIQVRLGNVTRRVLVHVIGISESPHISFRRQVMAVLSVGGCNGGTCHGSPNGKNGFRLSLWGADPVFDFFALTRDASGRRSNATAPAESLILRKALGRMPHEGGVRFSADSLPARILEHWLAAGMPPDLDSDAVPELRVEPPHARLDESSPTIQLVVHARFPGEPWRDVTRLTVFQCTDPTSARVSPTGLVEFRSPGEVAILCRYLGASQIVRLSYLPTKEGFVWKAPPALNPVDSYVFARLQELQIRPSPICSDSVFLRRVYLDLLGRLPTVPEAREFLSSQAPDKREQLVDKLLADPQFGQFWARRWLDVLRANQKRLPRDVLVAFYRWWQERLQQSAPFDQVVRELLTASGNTRDNPPAAYYTVNSTPEDLAETTAQVFLGVRIGCARCHNHPFERWTQDDYYGLAACFARVDRRNDPNFKPNRPQPPVQIITSKKDGEILHPLTGRPVPPRPLLGKAPFASDKDRRSALADWLTARDNPFFARALANRIWFHLFGRGIIEPPDDIRDTNPPSNGALLDFLARELADHQFDCKHLVRLIVCSATYQLASEPASDNAEEIRLFARVRPRLLTAEQLLDAICQVTEVPENFTDFPDVRRAVALPDSLSSHPFLSTFGQPPRELPCECERHTEPNLAQALQLVSGSTLHRKITAPNNRLGRLLQTRATDEEILKELYLAAFSRPPSDADRQTVLSTVRQQTDRRSAWEDVLWSLLNSSEFLYRP